MKGQLALSDSIGRADRTDRPGAVAMLPAVLAAGMFASIGYLVTLSAHYSSDGMAFARLVRTGDLSAPLFFQAEHLGYPFVGWAVLAVGRTVGLVLDPLLVLQVLNALGGGVAIAVFGWTAFRLVPGQRLVATGLTATLATSYGWWYHASDAEDQILANAGILISFAALALGTGPVWAGWQPTARGTTIVGGLAWATLIHATSVLFAPVLVVMLVRTQPLRDLARLAVLLVLMVLVPYVIVGAGLRGYVTFDAWRAWLLAAPGQGVWGRLSPRNLWAGAQSLTAAAVYLPELPTLSLLRAGAGAAWFGIGAMAGIALMTAVAIGSGLRERTRLGIALLVWLAVVVAFGAYWAPDDFQFWLLALPPIYLLFGQTRAAALVPVLAVGLVGWNLLVGLLPRHDPVRNSGLVAARCLGERLRPNDLVVAPGWDWAGDYLPYFTEIPVLSLNDTWVLAAHGDRTTFFGTIEQRIADTRRSGGRVYLVRLDTLESDEQAFFTRVTGLSSADFRWQRVPAFQCGPESVSEILP